MWGERNGGMGEGREKTEGEGEEGIWRQVRGRVGTS